MNIPRSNSINSSNDRPIEGQNSQDLSEEEATLFNQILEKFGYEESHKNTLNLLIKFQKTVSCPNVKTEDILNDILISIPDEEFTENAAKLEFLRNYSIKFYDSNNNIVF